MSSTMLAELKVEQSPDRYEIKKMRQIHHEIVMLALLGNSNKLIAQKLDVTEAMVGYTLNSAVVKRKMELLRNKRDEEMTDIFKRLEELAPVAIDEMEQMLINPNTGEATRRHIAADILDRAGFGAVKKVADVSDTIKTSQIEKIKQDAKEAGIAVEVEEAEYVDEDEEE